MKVLAERHGSQGWMPIGCPEYGEGSISCVSMSGGNICGYCLGGHDLSSQFCIIECAGGLLPHDEELGPSSE